jgi:glycine betaine/proline transport system ATP-binding protein
MDKKVKVKLDNVFKIFGKDAKKTLKLLDQGMSKDEILEKTGNAVGVIDASFEVYEGETLVIMGLSGSGKSTLLRCINRIHEPTAGKVYVDDIDVTALNNEELRKLRQKKFGMVFQRFALFPHKTILENVIFGLEIQGIDKKEQLKKGYETLTQVGLKGWENYLPDQLSGGMQQRVGLARALAIDPDILLMDEAFSALDPLIRTEMQDELLALENQVNKTIIFITHDLDEALRLGDRIILMKDGKIVQIGTNEEILKNPATEYVERFVENVDMIKVLTANDVLVKASYVTSKDGPRTALHLMGEKGISSIFVCDKSKKMQGIVMAEDARNAVKENKDTLDEIIIPYKEYVAKPDTPLQDVMPVMVDNRFPVAVIDDSGIFQGMIVRGSIIAGLIEKGGDND